MTQTFTPSLSGHDCDAVVLCCMDFRYWQAIIDFVHVELGIPGFDLVTEAGGVKYIAEENKAVMDDMLAELDISFKLHHAKTIVLINHEDCGGYGGKAFFGSTEKEEATHKQHLTTAMTKLQEDHPEATIIPLYARFGTNNSIEIVSVSDL